MKKRIISLLLVLVMLIGLLPMNVLATETDEVSEQTVLLQTSLDDAWENGVYTTPEETLKLRLHTSLNGEVLTHLAALDEAVLEGAAEEDGWMAYSLSFAEEGSHTLNVFSQETEWTYTLVYQPQDSEKEPTLPEVNSAESLNPAALTQNTPTQDTSAANVVGSVRVIVENNTTSGSIGEFWMAGASEWTGEHINMSVPLKADSSMISVVVDAVESLGEGHSIYGNLTTMEKPTSYIAALDGLKEYSSGTVYSGWMMTLNDWFINQGANEFTYANGTLRDGDEIRVTYSVTGGGDVGSDSSKKDKKLSALTVSGASLQPNFSGAKTAYELVIGETESATVSLNPTALNKNFLVGIYKNLPDGGVDSLNYKAWYEHDKLIGRGKSVSVVPGDVLTVVVGAKTWPSMSNGQYGCYAEEVEPCVYTFTVVQNATQTGSDFETFFTELKDVATVANDEDYPFEVTEDKTALVSSNAGVGSSNAGITLTFLKTAKLTFFYKASSEKGFDFLKISRGTTVLNGTYNEKVNFSGDMETFVSYTLEAQAGDVICLSYSKDNSGDSGSDCVWLKDFTVALPHKVVFYANDGTDTTAEQGIFDKAKLNANTFVRAGYRFDGWATSANGEVVYKDGADFTIGDSDAALYAVWTKVWNVTFPNMQEGAKITVKQGATEIAVSETANTWLLEDGDYTYSASLFGYEEAKDVAFTVNGADLQIEASLTAQSQTTLTFQVSGQTAETTVTITVYNREGTQMVAEEDQPMVYVLPEGAYTYNVEAKGYKKIKNHALTVSGQTQTESVTLEVSHVWDGTVAENLTEVAGVYQISNGSELAKFAALVNGGETAAKGVLTSDIVLNEEDARIHKWTPIGTSSKAFIGTLNGGGHTIEGLYIDATDAAVGLFGFIGENGEVHDLTIANAQVKSTDSSTSAYAGLIAASNAGTICGVTLENSRVSGGCMVGGIAGRNTGTVTGCANKSADVEQNKAKDKGVGGIVGANEGEVSLCYNKAHIVRGHSSTNYAYLGGVVGQNSGYSAVVDSCYNHGTVDTAYYVGGIVGNASGKVQNCYNVGTSGKKALIGSGTATVKNCYYLDGCGTDDTKGTKKTAEEFKTLAASLGGSFEDSQTYPILKWENPNATYAITLTVKPANAVVTLGKGMSEVTGSKTEDAQSNTATYVYSGLGKGDYTWSVSCNTAAEDDYQAQSGTIVLSAADVTREITLAAKTYDVSFRLIPANAVLTLKTGTEEDAQTIAPKTEQDENGVVVYALAMGSYSYSATAFGYADAADTITVNKGTGLGEQTVTLIQNATFDLQFTNVPEGAQIKLWHPTAGVQTQSASTGSTVTYALVPETYLYSIKKTGFKTIQGEVTIADAGQTIPVAMTVLAPWTGTVGTGFAGGDGTKDSPYEIESGEELAYLSQQINANNPKLTATTYYVLTSDIDLNSQPFTPIGTSSSYPFNGHFDGAQHTITNLSVTKKASNVGLFGRVSGTVENLTLNRAQISGGNADYGYIGAVAGYTNGTIQNCVVKNSTVNGTGGSVGGIIGEASANVAYCAVQNTTVNGADYVGGVVGRTSRSVEKCYAVQVNVTASGNYAGGVLGSTSATYYTLANLFARGSVSGADYVGGLIGGCESTYSSASLKNAYAVVNVTATNGSYGAVAARKISATAANVFYSSESTLSGKTAVEGGTEKTNAELKDSSILTGLGSEFELYVQADGSINAGFPYLKNAPAMEKVILQTLTAPTVTWSGKTASWTAVEQASGYAVKLTKQGESTALFEETLQTLSKDFTTEIDLGGSGNYTVSVTALGDGEKYQNSNAATAESNQQVAAATVKITVTAQAGHTFVEGDVPVIKLKMADGTELTLENGVERTLPLGTYTYTVKAKTFREQSGTFTLDASGKNLPIVLEYSTAWDGETTAAPQQDENDVYLISNGYELAWFRDQVNKATSSTYALNAKLTDNIDLGGYDWTPISTMTSTSASTGYTGTFDGNGKTISGLKPIGTEITSYSRTEMQGAGLFGYVYKDGIVKNLTVEGSMTAVKYSGGVVALLAGGTVENCVNKMNLTLAESCTDGFAIGGVVGYMTNYSAKTSYVVGCRNEGSIQIGAAGRNVGGVVGNAGYGTGVVNCANTGTVSGGEKTGGVIGNAAIPVTACYNTGVVSGTKNDVGGIAGFANKVITNCYNTQTITGSKGNVGGIIGNLNSSAYGALVTGCWNSGSISSTDSTVETVGALVGTKANNDTAKTVERSFYLAGSATKAIGANNSDADETTSVTETELHSKRLIGLLGGKFASLTGTNLPVLNWQSAQSLPVVTFVVPEGATVTVKNQTAIEEGVYALNDGEYEYSVSKTGFVTENGTLTVSGESQSVTVELAANTFRVTFTVQTSGATIQVQNEAGETMNPTEENANVYALANGTYTYVVSKFGFESVSGSFVVSDADVNIPQITLNGATTYTVTLNFTDEQNASITPASVMVTASDNTTVSPNAAGTFVYTLPNGTYTYVVEDSRYYKVEDSFTVNGKDLTIPVTMEEDRSWDGSTLTAVTPTDGVYEIGNAAELAWFAAQVNAGNADYDAKLTANIYINYNGTSNHWTSIGSYSKRYTGTFDGNGKAVYGLDSALFGYNGEGSLVKNLTVYGNVSGESNVGGLCNASYGSFEGCVNRVNVTATGQRVGGIVGLLGSSTDGHISNCANYGTISTTHESTWESGDYNYGFIGGIVGMSYVPVSGCLNAGSVTASSNSYGSSNVGGIVGSLDSAALTHCYNTGTISAAHYGAGIVGNATGSASAITNCYNVGTISVVGNATNPQSGAIAGTLANSATVSNCYFLKGCYTYTQGLTSHTDEGVGYSSTASAAQTECKLASEMKLESFVIALSPTQKSFHVDSENINEGYPILAWQGGRAPQISQDEKDVAADKAVLTVEPSVVTKSMTLTLAHNGANGSVITWSSSKPEIIADNGVVTLPTENDAVVTLTATLRKGNAVDTKTFEITVKTQSSADKQALEAIQAKLKTNFRIPYQTGTVNAATTLHGMLTAAIQESGDTTLTAADITVAVVSAGETSYGSGTLIAADGTVTYYYADPGVSSTINGDAIVRDVTFKLTATRSGANVTTDGCVVRIPWDQARVRTAMTAAANTLSFDTIKGENTTATEITKNLTLPQQLAGYGWTLISWDSSREDVIAITGGSILDPFVGDVEAAEEDTDVTLTATFTFNRNNKEQDGEITVEKEIHVTVPGKANSYAEDIQNALANFKLENLKYAAGADKGTVIDPNAVTEHIQLPTSSVLGIDGGRNGYKIQYSATVTDGTCPVSINGYRANVTRPIAEQAVEVTLTLKLTKQTDGILNETFSGTKSLKIQILPLKPSEITKELELLEKVKNSFFDGINDKRNVAADAITTNLHNFQEAYLNNEGKVVWVYNVEDVTDTGIVPADLPGYDSMSTAGWRAFRSSNTNVITHENLLVTCPETENAQVTITANLKSYRFGNYYETYKDDETYGPIFQRLAGEQVTVTLTVLSKAEQAKITALVAQIEALTSVTTESGEAIEAAESAYAALSSGGKKLVTNVKKLTQARTDYDKLMAEDNQDKADRAAAKAVDDLIDAIGEVTLGSEAAIKAAQDAYHALNENAKKYVTKLDTLKAAQNKLAALKAVQAYADALKNALAFIQASTDHPTALNSTKGEWAVVAAARAGCETATWQSWYEGYADSLQSILTTTNGQFESTNDYARAVLAWTALGQDAKNVRVADKTYDLVTPLTQKTGDVYKATIPGTTSTAFAIIALDSKPYGVEDRVATSAMVAYLLDCQLTNGAWGINSEYADANIDATAMVLTALAAHKDQTGVEAAIERAVAYLASKQGKNGYGNACTDAQVVTALSALGMDCTTGDFAVNGSNPLKALLSYQLSTGGFAYDAFTPETVNQMATEQATYALVAYDRFQNARNRLYDMRDAKDLLPKNASVEDVMEKIAAIGTVDSTSGEKILEARAAYDALDEKEKAEVENYAVLVAAEESYKRILTKRKLELKALLTEQYEKLDRKDYTQAGLEKLKETYENGLAAIEAAKTVEQAEYAWRLASKALSDVKGGSLTVSFRLIGDAPHGSRAHEEFVTWIPTTVYTVAEDATVADLFVQALTDNGLYAVGTSNGYVSSIYAPSILGGYALSEFTNGKNSGWMFEVNGLAPNVGMDGYTLRNGDTVVWYYTDDYMKSSGSPAAEDITPEMYVRTRLDRIVTCGKHGTVTPEVEYADIGKSMTFTFKPDAGYRVKDVKVEGESVGAVTSYTVKKLSIFTRIEVSFTDGTLPFVDVTERDWFYEDVVFAYDEGLFSGTSATTFSPNAEMTRAMLVTVLYRLAGQPAVSGRSGFADVVVNSYYEDAVTWAADNGIVTGISDSRFCPDENVTREQLATILYRYAQYMQYGTAAAADLTQFKDASVLSRYAQTAMEWAVAEKLVNGAGGKLMPKDPATRAQVAAILHRFVENIAK